MDGLSRSQSSHSFLLPPRRNNSNDEHDGSMTYGSYGTASTSTTTDLPTVASSPSLSGSTGRLSSSTNSFTSLRVRQQLFSTTRLDHHGNDVDRQRIYRAAEEAGLSSFGIIAVDVWWMDKMNGGNSGQITHSGVFWTSPTFCQQNPSLALDRLVDPSHPQHVMASPQVAGAGLAGYYLARGAADATSRSGKLEWSNLQALTLDPFQPPYERMVVLEEAGFGKVTGIPFEASGHHGMVLYFARATADERMLNEPSNIEFLRMATQHIGTASALSQHREASVRSKSQRSRRTRKRLKTKLCVFNAFWSLSGSPKYRKERSRTSSRDSLLSGSFRRFATKWERQPSDSFLQLSIREGFLKPLLALNDSVQFGCGYVVDEVKNRVLAMMEKSKGGTIRPPPPLPWWNAGWAFVGVFLTFLALVGFGQVLSSSGLWDDNNKKPLVLAPFGALLTLQYSLTAAPASQPRNIVYGQFICISTALLFQHFGMERLGWSQYLVLPLAGAMGIATMTKLGIPHPPAAAAMVALLDQYVPGKTNFTATVGMAVILILANFVAIGMAIAINNLSRQRQYPVYWAMGVGLPKSIIDAETPFRSRMARTVDDGKISSSESSLPLFSPYSSHSLNTTGKD